MARPFSLFFEDIENLEAENELRRQALF